MICEVFSNLSDSVILNVMAVPVWGTSRLRRWTGVCWGTACPLAVSTALSRCRGYVRGCCSESDALGSWCGRSGRRGGDGLGEVELLGSDLRSRELACFPPPSRITSQFCAQCRGNVNRFTVFPGVVLPASPMRTLLPLKQIIGGEKRPKTVQCEGC